MYGNSWLVGNAKNGAGERGARGLRKGWQKRQQWSNLSLAMQAAQGNVGMFLVDKT